MCGFVFYHSFDGTSLVYDDLEPALDSLLFRGPDELCAFGIDNYGSLHHCCDTVEIKTLLSSTNIATIAVHARLAITGASNPNSRQPYYDHSLKQLILFNGEIYNYKELALLHFSTIDDAFVSDTYLLALLLGKYGSKAFDYIDGIYSIVIYNLDTGLLSAYRDPIGVKPLYYSITGSHVVLGSTLRACASLSRTTPKINTRVASNYLRSGRLTLENATILDGYHKLPSGFNFSCCLSDANLFPYLQPWFSYDTLFPSINKSPCVTDNLVISTSISSQIPSIPFAILLSAGIDSSVVALECSKHRPHGIYSYTGKTFHISDDESDIASYTSSILGLQHQTVVPSADDFEAVTDEFMNSTYMPLASFSHLLELFIYRSIHCSGSKVVLAGHGADELFSGYTLTDAILCFITSLISFRFNVALRFLRNYASVICSPFSILAFLKVLFSSYFSVVIHLLRFPSIRLTLVNKFRLLASPLYCIRFNYLFLDSQLQSQVEPTDQASMFNSLECRIPLVSLSLIKEFFSCIPSSSASGLLKSSLRSILESDSRTSFLAKPSIKRGFQFSYIPSLHGLFAVSMDDSLLRRICLDKLFSLINR